MRICYFGTGEREFPRWDRTIPFVGSRIQDRFDESIKEYKVR